MAVLVACALGVAIGLLAVWSSARAAITIAVVEIAEGKLVVVRGGLAPRVLEDLRDVAARPRIPGATLRILRERGRGRMEIRGKVSEVQMQRMRNVVGSVPVAHLVKARRR